MSNLDAWLLIAEITLGLWLFWVLLNWAFDHIRFGTGCTCSRHRWDPSCPVHGRET